VSSRRKPPIRPKKYSVSTVVELLALLDDLELAGDAVAFRGQSLPWALVPDIGRPPFLHQGKGYDHWIAFEEDLLNEFKKLSHPFIVDRSRSDWDWLYIARHHGLPTRLLDWSTNPLKGLFFAVQDFRYDDKDSVLWALEASGWVETMDREKRNTLHDMLLVYPPHINERIVAQDACFTVFPLPPSHGDFVPAEKTRLVKRTVEIVIPANARLRMRTELVQLGLTHRTMFPGLDGVARSIRQDYGEGWLDNA
jgi:FRG domain